MAVPAVVHATPFSGTTSPVAVTIPAAAAGNCLVVALGEGNSTANPAVTGITLGGSADHFALAASVKNNADANCEIWTDQDCAGGTAISVAFSGGTGAGNGIAGTVYEVSDVVSTAAVDKTAAAGAGTGSPNSGSTGTLTQANEIAIGVIAAIGAGGAPTLAGPASPWVNQAQGSAARTSALTGAQVVSATTALTYSGTASTGRVGAAVITLLGTAGIAVALPVAQFTAAAPAPLPQVVIPLPAARFTIAAPAPAPAGVVALPAARFAVAAPAPALPRTLLVSLASKAGTDDYGNAVVQGIYAGAGLIRGPDAFFYDPFPPASGNLIQSVAAADGTDDFGNAYLAGTATYADNGSFWSAVVIAGGVVNWYKAAGPGGPWAAQAGIGFTFNTLTGGGLEFTAPAGISGALQLPQPSPAATAAAIIAALQAAGIFA